MDLIELQDKITPQITKLLKKEPESISSVEKTQEGWRILCDILEKKSVPETYDLLKIYEFILDNKAKITGFKQLRKVRRGDTTQ